MKTDQDLIQNIPFERIDLSDETFSVNFMPDLERLQSSIEQVGLIQPVLLWRKGDRYRIVCGFRRISVVLQSGRSAIEARVISREDGDELGLFSLSLHDNLTTRGLNMVERAIALGKLVHRFGVDPAAVMETFFPLFALEPNEKILKTYLSLAGMDDEVKRYVLREEVSRSNIRMLAAFSSEDRAALLSLFSFLKLGESRLREMLTLIGEITRRDHCRAREIAERPEIRAVLDQGELTPGQRTEKVKKVLTGFRYPAMVRMEEQFLEKEKRLNLPPEVSLHHPPYFEGRGLRMTFQFETLEQYRSLLAVFSALLERKDFEELIEGRSLNRLK